MSGSTSRVALYLPGGGSTAQYGADEVADVDKLNANFTKLDSMVYPAVPTLTALVSLLPNVPEGAIVSVLPFVITGTTKLQQSVWQKTAGIWRPAPGTVFLIDSSDGNGQTLYDAATAIYTFQQANSSALQWTSGQKARDFNGIEVRWVPSKWVWWNWYGIPQALYGSFISGAAAANGSLFEMSIAEGVATLAVAIQKAGMNADVGYFALNNGFRPYADVHTGGHTGTNGGARAVGSLRISNNQVMLTNNAGNALDVICCTFNYRVAY